MQIIKEALPSGNLTSNNFIILSSVFFPRTEILFFYLSVTYMIMIGTLIPSDLQIGHAVGPIGSGTTPDGTQQAGLLCCGARLMEHSSPSWK